MEGLSKEYMINQIKGHKDIIRDATDRLSGILFKVRVSKSLELSEEDSLAIRKILHEIVSELSMIGGYCDNWTREYIDRTVTIIGGQASSRTRYIDAFLLDFWAMKVNGIMVDFTKTPFKLSQLKPIFDMLKKAFEAFKQKE